MRMCIKMGQGDSKEAPQYTTVENIIIEENANESDDAYYVYIEIIRKEVGWSLSITIHGPQIPCLRMQIMNPHGYRYTSWMRFLHNRAYGKPINSMKTRTGELAYNGSVFTYKSKNNTTYTIPDQPLYLHLKNAINRAYDAGFEFEYGGNNSCM
jgi:hypothetical protein